MNILRSTKFGFGAALFIMVLVFAAPTVHAQDVGDGFDCCSDYGSVTAYPTDYGSVTAYPADYGSVTAYPTDYGSVTAYPDYSSTPSYSSPSFYASTPSLALAAPSFYASTPSYASPNYYTSTPSFYAPSKTVAPSNTLVTDNGNTNNSYNPCATPNSCSTYDNGNTNNSYNSTTDACIYSGSCSTDNHSVVNANTTISSPTTVTISNPPPVNQQIVYSTPSSYAPTPTYYQPAPVYTAPVCTTCACNSAYCPHPVAYNPATPYVTLSQVPYTGLDLGPIGTVVYWSFLVLFSLVGAYLIVVKRAYRSLATSIGVFLFGSEDTNEHAEPAAPMHVAPAPATPTPVATRTAAADYTDEFILSQIKRA